jgi:galactokinase
MAKVDALHPSFASLFHRSPDAAAAAPGRVNLIGDHTDYNGGYVLPMVLPQQTSIEVALRSDRTVRVWSGDVEAGDGMAEYRLGDEHPRKQWIDYVMAVTAVLGRDHRVLPGLDLRLTTRVPLGAGLSSSASLLVALLRALSTVVPLNLSDLDVARIAHCAETEFVGAPVGIMDQMVCSLGRPGFAFFLDTARLEYEHVAIPSSLEWVVIHSGVHHNHATGLYGVRRRECEEASRLLGAHRLRDLEGEDRQSLLSQIQDLPPPLDARARHVVTENERVLAGVDALKAGSLAGFGKLMYASHASLAHDFAVSVPDTDLLVELAQAQPAVFGARLTGGGFGGSVVIAVEEGMAQDVAAQLANRYRTSGRAGMVLLPEQHEHSDFDGVS